MFIELLSHTPLYVYWIFFSLLFVGFSQTKTRQTGLKRSLGIPFILILLSIYAITHDFGFNLFSMTIWLGGIILVMVLNKVVKNQKEIRYSPLTHIFTISGSYMPLLMMMILFFTKYTVGAVTAMDLPILHAPMFIGIVSLLYGIFSGMYLVRFFILVNKLKEFH